MYLEKFCEDVKFGKNFGNWLIWRFWGWGIRDWKRKSFEFFNRKRYGMGDRLW